MVEIEGLKREILATFARYLMKSCYPFCYISICIDPSLIDVNAHPAKNLIIISKESQLISTIINSIELLISQKSQRKVFETKSICVESSPSKTNDTFNIDGQLLNLDSTVSSLSFHSTSRHSNDTSSITQKSTQMTPAKRNYSDHRLKSLDFSKFSFKETTTNLSNNEIKSIYYDLATNIKNSCFERSDKGKTYIRASIDCSCILKEHIYVGNFNSELILFQHETSLFTINYSKIAFQFFYQKIINSMLISSQSIYLETPIKIKCFNHKITDIVYNIGIIFNQENHLITAIPSFLEPFLSYPSNSKFNEFFCSFFETCNSLPADSFIFHHFACYFSEKFAVFHLEAENFPFKIFMEAFRQPPFGYSIDVGLQKITETESLFKIFERC